MPYGQNRGKKSASIDINALLAKEKTKFKQFLSFNPLCIVFVIGIQLFYLKNNVIVI